MSLLKCTASWSLQGSRRGREVSVSSVQCTEPSAIVARGWEGILTAFLQQTPYQKGGVDGTGTQAELNQRHGDVSVAMMWCDKKTRSCGPKVFDKLGEGCENNTLLHFRLYSTGAECA